MQPIILDFERQLNFTTGDETRKGKLIVSRIEFVEERDAWACYWSLDFVKLHHTPVYGRDPLESLMVALWQAFELVQNSGIPGVQIWWREVGDNGGLAQLLPSDELRTRKAPPRRNA
jgi:hypothetical protein